MGKGLLLDDSLLSTSLDHCWTTVTLLFNGQSVMGNLKSLLNDIISLYFFFETHKTYKTKYLFKID